MNCGFCQEIIEPEEDFYQHTSGEMRHVECVEDNPPAVPSAWVHSDDIPDL